MTRIFLLEWYRYITFQTWHPYLYKPARGAAGRGDLGGSHFTLEKQGRSAKARALRSSLFPPTRVHSERKVYSFPGGDSKNGLWGPFLLRGPSRSIPVPGSRETRCSCPLKPSRLSSHLEPNRWPSTAERRGAGTPGPRVILSSWNRES